MRLRSATVWAYAAAVVTMPVAVFLGPALGDGWAILGILLCGGVIAMAGLALLAFAAVRQTARDAAVVLAALPAFAGAVLLLPLAGTAGSEAALDRNAAGLEALVAEIQAAPSEVRAVFSGERTRGPALADEQRRTVERLREQARALGFHAMRVEPGYVLFFESAPFAPGLLHVTGPSLPVTIGSCAHPDLHFAGGRWYLYRCPGDEYD